MAKKIYDRLINTTVIDTKSEALAYANSINRPQSTAVDTQSKNLFPDNDQLAGKDKFEEIRRKQILLREYSVPYDMLDNKPPFPGMVINCGLMRWEPENLDEFILEHGEEFKRMLAEKKEQQEGNLEGLMDVKRPRSTTQRRKSKAAKSNARSVKSPIGIRQQDSMVQPEHRCTDATVIPDADMPFDDVSDFIPETMGLNEIYTRDPSKDEDSETQLHHQATEPEALVSVEQSKKSRVSAKMVDAEFDELSQKYFQVTSLGEKKPVFLPLELRDALDAIARLSGDRKLSASHVAINIIRAFLNEHRELINRKLAGVKLSI